MKIKSSAYEGEGMVRVYENGKWMVGIKNWKPMNDLCGIDRLERHNETDESFVLIDGKCTLFFANETPHRPLYLQAPNYIPIPDPTDITNPLQHDRLSKTLEQIHYHANAATILQVGKWLQYLKDEDVYDNTRIIIVADHGYFLMVEDFKNFPEKGVNYAKYNPLLAVKDFDAQGTIKTLDTFMTNADVPLIALQGFVDKPINPLTNKLMHEYVDKEQVNVYNISNHGQDNQGYQYQFKSDHNFIVTENIFLEENWRENKNF
mgnify:CR=1 FL=1